MKVHICTGQVAATGKQEGEEKQEEEEEGEVRLGAGGGRKAGQRRRRTCQPNPPRPAGLGRAGTAPAASQAALCVYTTGAV